MDLKPELTLAPLGRLLVVGAGLDDDGRAPGKIADEHLSLGDDPAKPVHDGADIFSQWDLNGDLGDFLSTANR